MLCRPEHLQPSNGLRYGGKENEFSGDWLSDDSSLFLQLYLLSPVANLQTLAKEWHNKTQNRICSILEHVIGMESMNWGIQTLSDCKSIMIVVCTGAA